MNKTVCIYHSIDLDGWMSAAIVKYWFEKTHALNCTLEHDSEESKLELQITSSPDSLHMLGYNYGDPIPDLSEYNRVIMCDISFPRPIMIDLLRDKEIGNFIWIDHHISAILDNKWLEEPGLIFNGIRDTKFAACELTWKYFFPNKSMPEIVRLLGRYDCFGHKGTPEEQMVLEFQYGARGVIANYEDAYRELKASINYSNINSKDLPEGVIWETGRGIYQYLCAEAQQIYKNGFEIRLAELISKTEGAYYRNFICINKERFNPINFGIDYHKDGYDGAACFHYANGMWNFSLYNDNGLVDCSVIAKQFGGGGHKGASGFRIKDIDKIII